MFDATAAVSWGEGRIDLFWVDAESALAHSAFSDGALDGARIARRDACRQGRP